MELRSINNMSFPAQAGNNFVEAMRSGSNFVTESEVEINCSRSNRAKAAIRNPMAVAHEYIHTITNVFKIFIGIQPTKSFLLHKKKNHSTYYKTDEKFGLFGHSNAAIGMNETSKRGALHHHLCAWLGLQSRLLEIAAAFPDMVKEVARVIDSQFQAEIETKYHVIDSLSKLMNRSRVAKKPKPTTIPGALMCRPCDPRYKNLPIVDDNSFKETYSHIAARMNVHQHSFTCFKGGSGKAGCRMGFPVATIDKTKPVQLEPNDNNHTENNETWNICDKIKYNSKNSLISGIKDRRITVYELKRSEIEDLPDIPQHIKLSDDIILKQFILNSIQTIIQNESITDVQVESFLKWLKQLNGETLLKIYDILKEDIPERNGLVVPFNDVVTVVLGCNSSVQFLGNAEQSRNTLYYLVPYLTKDNVSLSNCIPIIKKAYDDVLERGSVAKDNGTDLRFAKHLAMRILNCLDTKMEISDTQAVAALLGMEAQVVTDIFWFIQPKSHIQYVKLCIKEQPNLLNFNETDEDLLFSANIENDENSNTSDYTMTRAMSDLFVDTIPDDNDLERDDGIHQNEVLFVPNAGNGKIYKRGDKLPEISIQMPYHYFYRGEHFAEFSRVEYYTLVQIVLRKSDPKADRQTGCGIKSARFDFAPSHVLYKSHVQMLRFHQPTPIFSNDSKAPKHPGEEVHSSQKGYASFIRKADQFALYYLTLFRPERDHFNAADKPNLYKYDWEAFKSWVFELENDDRIISHCRLVQLENHVHGLKTNTTLRKIARDYRERKRRIWTESEKNQFNFTEQSKNFESGNFSNGIDPDDYDVQNAMTPQQLKTATIMNTYGLNQIEAIKKLCNFPVSFNYEGNEKVLTNLNKAKSIVYSGNEFVDLEDLATLLVEQNQCNIEMEESLPLLVESDDESLGQLVQSSSREIYLRRIIQETSDFIQSEIEDNGKKPLGLSQKNVVKFWVHELCEMKSRKTFGQFDTRTYKMPLILLLGLPGTGKSFVINAVTQLIGFLKLGLVLKTAHYGVAAMNISGITLHKLFKILFNEGSNSKSRLRDQDLLDMQRRLKSEDLFMLIIDEISNVPPHLLQRVNSRLQQLRNCSLPFGGLAVLLVGDFLQKSPPGATSLVRGLMYMTVIRDIQENKSKSPFTPKVNFPFSGRQPDGIKDVTSNTSNGLRLFEQFQLFSLKEQQRASEDICHTSFLERIGNNRCKITTDNLNIYQHLSKKDMKSDFADACFIVSTNRERQNISFIMAQQFAFRHKCPIIRWRRDVQAWFNRPSMEEELDLVEKDPIFYEHFVQGIDGYLTENINVSLMIGNGTKIRYHSLSFHTRDQEDAVKRLLQHSKAGQVVTLEYAPKCVNVQVYQETFNDEIKQKLKTFQIPFLTNGINDEVILPIFQSKFPSKLKSQPTITTSKCRSTARVIVKPLFPLQLGSAVTVEKAQGRTINKVVVCLSKRGNNVLEMDINSIFVALSRVRRRDDLRLLIHSNESKDMQFEYLQDLIHDREYFDYLAGFDDDGEHEHCPRTWNRNRAIHKLISKKL